MNYPMISYTADGLPAEASGVGGLTAKGRRSKASKRWSGPHHLLLSCAVLLLLPIVAFGQTAGELFPPKPDPAVFVHDYSGWLSAGEKAILEQKLRDYNDTTSTQIVVMIRPDLGDYDKASYAFELGNRWGIGRKSKNNGVVMLIKSEPPDRGIFIATGYGTEGALPDITAGRIIRGVMAPYFREKRYYEGIDAGLDAIKEALAGEFQADEEQQGSAVVGFIVLAVFLLIFFLVIFFIIRARRGQLLSGGGSRSTRGDGGWGGWWLGSGGFGSGGGGWGGGGDSGGGWGGGFGGGSFGGGGAGGDW